MVVTPQQTIPRTSTADNLRLLLCHVLPTYLQGLFTRNRFWTRVFSRLHRDPLSIRFLTRLRRKYGMDCLMAKLGGTPTLLVFDLGVVRRVLASSPEPYASPDAKRRGMSRFQPHAVTISRGSAWTQRRQFNEHVLAAGTLHPLSDTFAAIVGEEAARLPDPPVELRWCHFEELFRQIASSVLFGRGAADDRYLWTSLGRLMQNANRSALRRPDRELFASFYAALRGYLRFPQPHSLAHVIRESPANSGVRVENQVPHWMFAMNETLAINCVRALALIAAHADIRSRVLVEIGSAPLEAPPTTRKTTMPTLSGALQEAMRLWPTTPYLMRKLAAPDVVYGESLPAGTQVMIVNGWFHRAFDSFVDGANFVPEIWADGRIHERFNHLSNGRQSCAGRDLAIFLGTEILARLLQRYRFDLKRPRIDSTQLMPEFFDHFAIRLRGLAL